MIRSVFLVAVSASFLLGPTATVAQSKRQWVYFKDEAPDSALCVETSRAVAKLRAEIGWPMYRMYGAGEGHPDRTVEQVTFHSLRVQSFVIANSKGEQRTFALNFYLVDIDNTPPVEMISFSTGGHHATGEGTTLWVLKNNLSTLPPPLPDRELFNASLEISPQTVRFAGKPFDLGYFIYPFAFSGRNYLFIEGNGDDYEPPPGEPWDAERAPSPARAAVVEIVPDAGLVTRCYFSTSDPLSRHPAER